MTLPVTSDRYAVIGVGCRFPGGANTPGQFWRLLSDGVDAITDVPPERFDLGEVYDADASRPGKMYTRRGGFADHVQDFDAAFFGISPREAVRIDPQQRVLLEVVWEALEDAGVPADRLAGSDTGVFIGISTHDYSDLQLKSRDQLDSYFGTGTAMSIAANRISYAFDFRGPSLVVDTACSSSLTAVHLACRSLETGESHLVIAGGVNLIVVPEPFIAFCKASMLSPDGRCKAFDARANGFVRSEGAGVVVLKPLDRAVADEDRIYAVIRGTATNQDGRTTGIAVPNGSAQEALIREALRAAGVDASAIDYVEAHGTGTRVGDPIEASAIGRVLSDGRSPSSPCRLGSVKTNIGHLEAGAGIAGLVKTALALEHRAIPPSLHFEQPNPAIAFDDLRLRVVTGLEPWPSNGHPRLAGVNSFGFGGANAHVVLEEAPPRRAAQRDTAEGRAHILPVSARHPDALRGLLGAYRDAIADESRSIPDLCYTAAVRRSHHAHRVCLTGTTREDFVDQIDALLAATDDALSGADGRTRGTQPSLAFVFTGMGPQWWAMGRQLLATEPVFRAAIEECDACLRGIGSWSLTEALAADETASRVDHADIAPAANFAIQLGLTRLWAAWGVVPDAIVGHSAGEIGAAHAAGALGLHDALLVAFHRGRLQHRASGTGTMLSAGVSSAEAAALVEGLSDRVSIAAVNSPTSVTLAGDRAALEQIAARLSERERFNRFLPVQVPYHGPQLNAIRDEMLASLAGLAPRAPSTPLLSTVTGTWVESDALGAGYWYDNVRQPVRFAEAIDRLIDDGVGLFLEVGPHPALARSIAECLAARNTKGTVLPTLRRMEDERGVMLRSLGAMYTRARSVHWPGVYPSGGLVEAPRYPWQRERYWFEPDDRQVQRRGGVDSGHPLLGHRLRSARPVWEAELGDPRLEYLEDHVVQNSPMLPGAAYAEMAFEAARAVAPESAAVVEDLAFRKAMFLGRRSDTVVQFLLDPDSSSFEIYGGVSGEPAVWTRHATGTLRTRAAESVRLPSLDVAAIRARCSLEVAPAQVYESLAARGLRYGTAFRGITALWRGQGDALVTLSLSAEARTDAGPYQVHPGLLDSAFQAMLAAGESLRDRDGTTAGRYLPASIKRLTLGRPAGATLWAHATVTRFDAQALEGNVVIADETGAVVLEVEALQCKSIEDSVRSNDGPADDALYQIQWEPEPLASRARLEAASVASSVDIGPRLDAEAVRLAAELGWVDRHLALEPTLDAIVVHYARAALLTLGWDGELPPDGGDQLAERLRVVARHRRLFGRLLEILRETPVPPVPDRSIAGELAEAARLAGEVLVGCPENRAGVELLRRSGERLHALLNGTADAREVLFAPAANAAWARFFAEIPFYQYYNTIVADAVAMAVEDLPQGAPVRVLEIGAGTGSTTAFILPRLSSRNAEYHFTDVSAVFLTQARERFRDQATVRFATLDIEAAPPPELGRQTFDVVVASNVLHATADLRTTLRNVKALLAPGGLLVLLEVSRKMPWVDLIFGITDGWWRFSDLDVRPDYALIGAERWGTLLEEAGFEGPVSAAEPSGEQAPVSAVILATVPRMGSAPRDAAPPAPARDWLVFADAAGTGERIATTLRGRGDRCVLVRAEAEPGRRDPDLFAIAPEPGQVRALVETLGAEGFRHDGIIHAWALDAPDAMRSPASDLVDVQLRTCGTVTALLQAYEGIGRSLPPVWLVTAGAQRVTDGEVPSLAQAPLWGFGRVLPSEQPRARCRLVDLDPRSMDEAVDALIAEIDAEHRDEFDEDVAYRGAQRHVARLRRVRMRDATTAPLERVQPPEHHQFRLEVDALGALETLTLRESPVLRPGPGEVAIRVVAAGLNFRDVMLALGMLPPMPLPGGTGKTALGFECAGVVTACGEGVEAFRPGDEVLASAVGSFASHVLTRAEQVAPKPPRMTFEEAASIPLVFATAHYGLISLARLAAGERVLIHAGTGGVGLAAIQVARWIGAEIFATAGSPEKREYLRALGIDHVMDSRSLAFADEVLAATGGEGVDVVLNSLAGEAITKGLSILRPYGRFIELGKRDILADTAIGLQPFDRSLAFASVALDKMFHDRTHLLGTILRETMRLMADGTFSPIPQQTFDVSEAEQAFRTLGQARHIGKLVLKVQDREYRVAPNMTRPLCRADGTYVVSGGLGGFGLAVARWLIASGARHLVLTSRSGAPTPENEAAFEALRELPARIVVHQGDVARSADVRRMLDDIRATMPPLRGVIHAAMVLDDVLLAQMTPERLRTVLEPKVAGAWNLHSLTEGDALDFFVMFSSFASIVGTMGQAAYAAANAFLDMLAPYRRALGLPALTVNWGALSDVGYVASHQEVAQHLQRHGTDPFTSAEAVKIMQESLHLGVSQLMAARVDWERWSAVPSKAFKVSRRLAHFASTAHGSAPDGALESSSIIPALASAAPDSRAALLETYMAERVARVIGTSPKKIASDVSLTAMGLDSLMAVELQTVVERDCGVQLPLDWLLEHITVRQLSMRTLAGLDFEAGTGASSSGDRTPSRLDRPGTRESAPAYVDASAPPHTTGGPPAAPVDALVVPPPPVEASRPAATPTAPRSVQAARVETSPAATTRGRIDYGSLDYALWSRRQAVARRAVSALFRIASSLEIEGLENIPANGPVVLAVNHLSMLDVPLLFTMLPRRSVCLAADSLRQKPFVRWFLDIGQTIYVHRGEADVEALAQASAVLRAGGMLGIAPEGTRSRTGGLARGHSGMVWLAADAGAVIVPVVAYGQEHILANLKRMRRSRVRVRIGAPLTVSLGDRSAASVLGETERVMRVLAAMLPSSYRGVYAEAGEERAVAPV